MDTETLSLDFLTNPENFYLLQNKKNIVDDIKGIALKDFSLFHIEKISFEDKAPRKKALENVLSAMRIEGTVFVYLIIGDCSSVRFYYGVAKDLSSPKELELNINDIGDHILQSSIKGNFRGSKLKKINSDDQEKILELIEKLQYSCVIEGVPGANEDNEKFQGVDRLVDVMLGDTFCLMIVAKPLNNNDVEDIEKNYASCIQLSFLYRSEAFKPEIIKVKAVQKL